MHLLSTAASHLLEDYVCRIEYVFNSIELEEGLLELGPVVIL